jgi:HSP20 family protein
MPRQHRLLSDLAAIEQQLSQLLRSANILSVNQVDLAGLAGAGGPGAPGGQTPTSTWTPPIDIYETSDAFILTAEMPGVKSTDIDIKVISETLLLRGERRWEPEAHHELYHRLESSYGKFERSFSLSESIDTNGITAELEQGVLKLTLPKHSKRSGQTVQQIPIQTGQHEPA